MKHTFAEDSHAGIHRRHGGGHRSTEEGGAVAVLLWIVAVLLVLTVLIFYVFGQIVPPNRIGLRQNYFSVPGFLEEGYSPVGLLPGLHWKIPGISTVHLLPRDFQFVHLNQEAKGGDLNMPQLEIPTTDGSKVKTDITLVLRFFETPEKRDDSKVSRGTEISGDGDTVPLPIASDRSHGGPRQLVNKYRLEREHQLRLFALTAEEALKQTLSQLSTTDYYNPVLREAKALQAQEWINEEVMPDGIQLWAALIRRYVYSERRIDDQIFNKNLQEATEGLNAAEQALQREKAKTEEVIAKLDAEIKDRLVEGEQARLVLISEADRYEVEKKSEGDRLVQEALAAVDKARNRVLTETEGADVYVAREMAPVIGTLGGGIVSGIDPYDVDAWVQKLIKTGGPADAGAQPRRAPAPAATGDRETIQ